MKSCQLQYDPIKYMFILKMPEDKSICTIGTLDNKYNFNSYEISAKDNLNKHTIQQLKNMFKNFKMNSSTNVVLSDTIDDKSAIYQYLSIIRQYVNFKFSRTSIEHAYSRIAKFHTSFLDKAKAVKITDYVRIYKIMRARNTCMWISSDIDYYIENISAKRARIQKILRICMYYMCIKQYFVSKNKK